MWYTYNTLRKTKIVSGRSGGRLVWATSISQYTQLLSTRYTAFSQWTNLDPIRAYRLIRVYHEVVSFSCKSEGKASLSFKISRRYFIDAQLYWLMPRIEEDVPPLPLPFLVDLDECLKKDGSWWRRRFFFTRERDDRVHCDWLHRLSVGRDYGEGMTFERDLRWTNWSKRVDQSKTITTTGSYGEHLEWRVRHETGVGILRTETSLVY